MVTLWGNQRTLGSKNQLRCKNAFVVQFSFCISMETMVSLWLEKWLFRSVTKNGGRFLVPRRDESAGVSSLKVDQFSVFWLTLLWCNTRRRCVTSSAAYCSEMTPSRSPPTALFEWRIAHAGEYRTKKNTPKPRNDFSFPSPEIVASTIDLWNLEIGEIGVKTPLVRPTFSCDWTAEKNQIVVKWRRWPLSTRNLSRFLFLFHHSRFRFSLDRKGKAPAREI